jgi:RimJ/RimL family protein N-acetyltransferase
MVNKAASRGRQALRLQNPPTEGLIGGMAILKTSRLVLRPLAEPDLEPLLDLYLDTRVREHLITRPENAAAFRPIFEGIRALADEGRMWAVTIDNAFIGRAGLYRVGEAETAELAYLLAPEVWGRGLATELGAAILDHAFSVLGEPKVVAITAPGNVASKRVLEKLGFARAGHYAHPAGVNADLFERLA